MSDLVVYGSKMSPFVRKVEAVLRYKQLDFDFEEINIMDQPDWYREMHPLKRVPTLRNRAVAAEGPSGTIPDSSAICGYLEKYCPEPALYPADPYAYGRETQTPMNSRTKHKNQEQKARSKYPEPNIKNKEPRTRHKNQKQRIKKREQREKEEKNRTCTKGRK